MEDLMEQIVIIGLGGIGSVLCDKISRFSNFKKDQETSITLVDGDYYEEKNLESNNVHYWILPKNNDVNCSEKLYEFDLKKWS